MTEKPSVKSVGSETGQNHSPVDAQDLFEELDEIASDADSSVARHDIHELRGYLDEARSRGIIGTGFRRLDARDAVEAFIGSVIFAAPLLVEDGVFDIADYLFGFTISSIPIFLVANTLFVVLMTYALVEWTGRNRTESRRLFGRIPSRVIMILVVSFLTAALLMTVWGRVGDWQPPTEAVARINVVWTVGSLGAALGDIISEDDVPLPQSTAGEPQPPHSRAQTADESARGISPEAPQTMTDSTLIDAIFDQLADLESLGDDDRIRADVGALRDRVRTATLDGVVSDQIRKYTTRDIAEAFVGSIFFSVPFLVEDGVFDVAEYFLSFRIGQFPVFFILNTAFVLLMVTALVYWAGPRDVQMSRPLFGFVPRRMVGIAIVSFLTAGALMTMWGRVGNWNDPVVAIARISVVWTVASFGGALGDILPGESSGDDINDDLADFGDRVEKFVE
ncbi:DUF2391 family protein [Haloarcula marina]|uniref:DUF2391 family protein n=1 Tax=Haloarcula marina TaxID=2961574 RepID=UPI0020B7FDA5|nr:hypothetical protein [Halomicroarcula marina]